MVLGKSDELDDGSYPWYVHYISTTIYIYIYVRRGSDIYATICTESSASGATYRSVVRSWQQQLPVTNWLPGYVALLILSERKLLCTWYIYIYGEYRESYTEVNYNNRCRDTNPYRERRRFRAVVVVPHNKNSQCVCLTAS